MKYLIYSLILIFALNLSSCTSVKKSYEKRDYEEVVSRFLDKNKYDDLDLSYFEKSYTRVVESDKAKILALKTINTNGERWEEIFDLYAKINERQNKLLRLFPLNYTNGEKANIEIFNFTAALDEARINAAEFYYDQGIKLLRSGIKSQIRQSLEYFNASKKYYISYKDINDLIAEAEFKGKNYVLLIVDKNPAIFLPPSFEQSILDNVKLTNPDQWVNIDYKPKENVNYDYVVKLNLYAVNVSPDALKETSETEEKTIEDGWQYLLDSKGNVKKDSLGNDIKVPKYTKISCVVKATTMNKTAQVIGDATIYQYATKDYLKNTKCTGNATFDYVFYQIAGNKNALSTETINKLNNPPRNFPSTFEMIELSKNELIKCYQDFILSNYNAFAYAK
jgi:hypothetical protein